MEKYETEITKAGIQVGKAIIEVAKLLYSTEFHDHSTEFLIVITEVFEKELIKKKGGN